METRSINPRLKFKTWQVMFCCQLWAKSATLLVERKQSQCYLVAECMSANIPVLVSSMTPLFQDLCFQISRHLIKWCKNDQFYSFRHIQIRKNEAGMFEIITYIITLSVILYINWTLTLISCMDSFFCFLQCESSSLFMCCRGHRVSRVSFIAYLKTLGAPQHIVGQQW